MPIKERSFFEVSATREGRFLAVFEQALAAAQDAVVPAFEAGQRPRERLRAGLAALLEFFDHDPVAARVLVVDALRAGPEVAERRGEIVEALAEVVHHEGMRAMDPGEKEPPSLTEQGLVNAVLGVIHARVSAPEWESSNGSSPNGSSPNGSSPSGPQLTSLLGPLMAMLLLPYVGARAARRELSAPQLRLQRTGHRGRTGPVAQAMKAPKGIPMRLTELTRCTLAAIEAMNDQGTLPSNNDICWATGDTNKGQMSRLLQRLERIGMIENVSNNGNGQGGSNQWRLTARGKSIVRAHR